MIQTTVQQKESAMDELLKSDQDRFRYPKIGDLVAGKVISASKSEVYVDIDGMTTGVVRGKELEDESGDTAKLKAGDRAQAVVVDIENERGEMELSFRQAGHQKAWDDLEQLMRDGTVVESKVVDANKGGLMIKVGNVVGFLPVSQLTTENYPRIEGGDKNKILAYLKTFINRSLRTKIITVNEQGERLIVSEKAASDDKQRVALATYKVGDHVKGKITGVVDFGAFVEFGTGLEGLVHISELAWQRIDDPRTIVKVGDEVEAEVITINDTRVSLSMKKLLDDPWKKVSERYTVGQIVKGKILKTNPFGAFVELDSDIHGLAHISELSSKPIRNPSDVVKIGETYKFKIIGIEPADHRLGLSITKVRSRASAGAGEPHNEKQAAGDITPASAAEAVVPVSKK